MFIQGADAIPGQKIKPLNLYRELRSSEVGRETLDLMEQNGITPVLSYQKPLFQKPGEKIYGIYNPNTGDASIYVSNTVSLERTAQTTIHEVTHGSGIGGSQRAEIVAEIRALKHTNPRPSFGEIRNIVDRIKVDYNDLPYRKYSPGQGNY